MCINQSMVSNVVCVFIYVCIICHVSDAVFLNLCCFVVLLFGFLCPKRL